jgi:hypothetical protein
VAGRCPGKKAADHPRAKSRARQLSGPSLGSLAVLVVRFDCVAFSEEWSPSAGGGPLPTSLHPVTHDADLQGVRLLDVQEHLAG